MSIKLEINEQQAQAIGICRQLLDMGSFNLPGKDLEVAAQAKNLLTEVVRIVDSALQAPATEAPSE